MVVKNKFDRRFTLIENDHSWVYQVDSDEEADWKLVLIGFAFKFEKDADSGFDILLVDTKTKK